MTNSTTPELLSDEALKEIEARAKKYKGLADRAATPADTEVIRWFAKQVAPLCQTVRALRELVYVPKVLADDAELTYRDETERLLRQTADLRDQLAQQRRTITYWQNHIKRMGSLLQCSAIDGEVEIAVKDLQSRLAQVEKDRDKLRADLELGEEP